MCQVYTLVGTYLSSSLYRYVKFYFNDKSLHTKKNDSEQKPIKTSLKVENLKIFQLLKVCLNTNI